MPETALVVGMGVSGEAVARHLRDRGARVVATDDNPTADCESRASAIGAEFVGRLSADRLSALVDLADVVVPSPGVPESHPVFALANAAGVPVRGEVELGFRWARHPIVAITGTNGKTTVTALTTAMLEASGLRAVAAGNIGLPLSDAVRRDVDVIVAEVSSFQLAWTDTFRPAVAMWLNVADDHLDWHRDFTSYAAAKARIWAFQREEDIAVVNADDDVVMDAVAAAPSRVVTFGLSNPADYSVSDGVLMSPEGEITRVDELPRSRPHDLANALAAAAGCLSAGGGLDGVRSALREWKGLPHRLTLVAAAGGVDWYDDSKATNPHAVLAALDGFESAVLLAGGRNKGLDLSALAEGADHVRAVVAVGEAAAEVESAFAGLRPVERAESMTEAVQLAADFAQPGDAVILSPGCASFDWYRSYAERGNDFAAAVRQLLGNGEREEDDVAG